MQKKTMSLIIGAIVLVLVVIIISMIAIPSQSITDRGSLAECQEKRNNEASFGDLCILDCQLIEPKHVPCRNIDADEVGGYGFYSGDPGIQCEDITDEDELEQILCFYGEIPFLEPNEITCFQPLGNNPNNNECEPIIVEGTDCSPAYDTEQECLENLNPDTCVPGDILSVFTCDDGRIVAECTCPDNAQGRICIESRDVACEIPDEPECTVDADCGDDTGLICVDQFCVVENPPKDFELTTGWIIGIILAILLIGGTLFFVIAKKKRK